MCEAYDRISHDYDLLVQDHTKITQEYEKIIADSNKFDKSEVLGLLREIGVKWTEVVKILEDQEKKRKETMVMFIASYCERAPQAGEEWPKRWHRPPTRLCSP